MSKSEVSISEKPFLTLDEASKYFNMNVNKLRELTAGDNNEYVLWNGTKRLIKREALYKFLKSQFSI